MEFTNGMINGRMVIDLNLTFKDYDEVVDTFSLSVKNY